MQKFLAVPRAAISFDAHESWFPGDGLTALVYLALANKANWCDAAAALPRQKVPLKRGQLVLAQRQFAEDLGIGRQQLRRCLDNLEKSGKINPQSNPHGSIITVCDYDQLFLPQQDEQPTLQPTSNPRPTHAQPNQDIETPRHLDKKTPCGVADAPLETRPLIPEDHSETKESPAELLALWNEQCRGAMRKGQEIKPGTKRWNSAKARLSEHPLESWKPIIARVAGSRFCRGEADGKDGRKPWCANFDWFIRPDTRTKILEGTYDDNPSRVSGGLRGIRTV